MLLAYAVAAVHVAGADGGFLDHYLFGPLGVAGHPALELWTCAVVLLPNLVGYGLLLSRSLSEGAVMVRG